MELTIANLTAPQLRRAAAIKDEIAELTKTLMALAGETQRDCAQVADSSARIQKTGGRKPRIAEMIAPEPDITTRELPAPTPKAVPDHVPQVTDKEHQVTTSQVTEDSPPTPNRQLTIEPQQTPEVPVTERPQPTTTDTATSPETGGNPEHVVSAAPAVIPAKWEIRRLLQEVARVITAHPEKIPALKTVGIPALTNEYLRAAIEVVAKLNFTAEKLNSSLWELGKNVTQDDAVLPAINQLGMRNLGDLLGKVNELERYANKRGQMLILARIWSLAGGAAEPADTEASLA